MKRFAIFKTGKHTDSSGNTREWTEADLDNIVSKYDSSKHEAPIVIGHPKDNAPAFGWIDKLERIGDTLYALPKQLANEFVEMVKKGMFKKRSISLYPDGSLRHVGFLGATPPAVKGLPDVEFKDLDKDTNIELSELIDETTETDEVTELKNKLAEYEEKLALLSEFEQKAKEAEALKDKIAQIEIEKQQALQNFSEIKRKLDREKFEQFISKNITEGKLLPKMVPLVNKLWECNYTREVYEFSDSTKAAPNDLLIEFIDSLPKVIDFGQSREPDHNKEQDKPASLIIAEEIKKQMNQ